MTKATAQQFADEAFPTNLFPERDKLNLALKALDYSNGKDPLVWEVELGAFRDAKIPKFIAERTLAAQSYYFVCDAYMKILSHGSIEAYEAAVSRDEDGVIVIADPPSSLSPADGS